MARLTDGDRVKVVHGDLAGRTATILRIRRYRAPSGRPYRKAVLALDGPGPTFPTVALRDVKPACDGNERRDHDTIPQERTA